jgi:hypothetical protein
MKPMVSADLMLDNAQGIVLEDLVPAWHRLSTREGLGPEERSTLLVVPEILTQISAIDLDRNVQLEIDFHWEDRNWAGRMDIEQGKLQLFSTLYQYQGYRPVLNARWQRTALEVCATRGLITHDPGHLWFWADCFKRCARAFSEGSQQVCGTFDLHVNGDHVNLILNEERTVDGPFE